MITCVFGELIDGKVKEKGTMVKMARGEMVRYMAENHIEDLKTSKISTVWAMPMQSRCQISKLYVFF